MKYQFSDFNFSSYGWLYLQYTGDTPGLSCVSPTQKKSFKSGQITEKMHNELKRLKNQFSGFCQLWCILYSKLIKKLTNFEYKNEYISETKKSEN